MFPDCPSYDLSPLTDFECSLDLVKTILESIPVNKACGSDGIGARIVRECSDALAIPLAKICSLSLSQGVFPTLWKRANVVPLLNPRPAGGWAESARIFVITPKPLQISTRNLGYLILHQFHFDCANFIEIPLIFLEKNALL